MPRRKRRRGIILTHVESPKDIVTPRELTQRGFLRQALRKTKEATPYVAEAIQLHNELAKADGIHQSLNMVAIHDELVAAAGFSDKSTNYFSTSELTNALTKVMERIRETAGEDWREEIVYRFLLTRGDSLGGSMRNIVGAEAGAIFTRAVLDALTERGVTPTIHTSKSNCEKIQAIQWENRLIVFDKSPKFIGKNIDVILFDAPSSCGTPQRLISTRKRYLACGELKGGIDPAGADEHWKTAKAALDRIRAAFKRRSPHLFFVGAAIESAMAEEIFADLKSRRLSYAANLHSERQLSDLATWLVFI